MAISASSSATRDLALPALRPSIAHASVKRRKSRGDVASRPSPVESACVGKRWRAVLTLALNPAIPLPVLPAPTLSSPHADAARSPIRRCHAARPPISHVVKSAPRPSHVEGTLALGPAMLAPVAPAPPPPLDHAHVAPHYSPNFHAMVQTLGPVGGRVGRFSSVDFILVRRDVTRDPALAHRHASQSSSRTAGVGGRQRRPYAAQSSYARGSVGG